MSKNEVESEPKTLTIRITEERQHDRSTETQTEQPIQTDPPKNPKHEKGNDPKSANQAIAYGNASYEKTILPAVFKITGRALVMAVKKIFQDRTLSTSRAAVTDGAAQINCLHITILPTPSLESRSGGSGIPGYPKFTERG